MRIDEDKILSDIRSLLRCRNNAKSLTEYFYCCVDIYNLAYIYSKLTGVNLEVVGEKNLKFENYMRKYVGTIDTNLYYYFKDQFFHTELSKKVISTFDDSDYIYYGRKNLVRLSEKEFFEIMRDFLGTYNNRLYNLFNESLENGMIDNRSIETGDAETSATFMSDNHMIVMANQYTTEGLVILAHELAHLDSNSILNNRSKKQLFDSSITFYEAYSHYMELCMFDYLNRNHILLKDTLINENNFYSYFREYFESLSFCANISSDETDYEILAGVSDGYQYSYGILIGTLLNERYRENSIETLKDIDNFLFTQGLVDKDVQLEMLGLSNSALFDQKVLAKRLKTHAFKYKSIVR